MRQMHSFRHPEPVEGSASVGVCNIFRKLILRQAQDDGILVRATRRNVACLIFFGLVLIGTSVVLRAQATDTTTNTPADTTQAPATPPVFVPGAPQNTAPPQEDIADIRPPFFFLHSWFWLWIALATLGLIALAVFLLNRFKSQAQINPKTAYDLALEKLEKARAMLREEDPVPYAVFVSETIRTYLGQRFQAPSTRRTTEEFLRQMENDPATPLATHRDLLRDFLQSCDMVKFARYQPTLTELEEVQQRALTFVTATKPAPISSSQRNGRLP